MPENYSATDTLERPLDRLDRQFSTWIETIITCIKEGNKLYVHKTNDYLLHPEFDESEMKFRCKRLSDDFEGKLYCNIYEIEDLFNQAKKKVKKSNQSTTVTKSKPETVTKSKPETVAGSVPVIKLIKSYISENPGCSYEDIEQAYQKNGIVLKSMAFKDYLKSLKADGDKSKKFTISIEENKYYFKSNQ